MMKADENTRSPELGTRLMLNVYGDRAVRCNRCLEVIRPAPGSTSTEATLLWEQHCVLCHKKNPDRLPCETLTEYEDRCRFGWGGTSISYKPNREGTRARVSATGQIITLGRHSDSHGLCYWSIDTQAWFDVEELEEIEADGKDAR